MELEEIRLKYYASEQENQQIKSILSKNNIPLE